MDLKGMDPVFGCASGKVEGRESSAFLPLVFRLHAPDDRRLAFAITDFHDNTWECCRSTEELEDVRDDVGISGAWGDFLAYLREAFLSANVTLVLGGPASAIGGAGATSGKIVALKAKGMPRISFNLKKLAGLEASDAMSDIAVHNCRSWQAVTHSFALEQAEAAKLKSALEAEQLKSSMLEEQVQRLGAGGKQQSRALALEQAVAPEASHAGSRSLQPDKGKAKARRVAPVSSRMKRRGTAIGSDEE